MGTNKLIDKLEDYFDLSKKKQRRKHDKLVKMIRKLERKKSKLEHKAQKEKEADATSSRYHDVERELQVISKLINKAEKKDLDA